MALFLFSRNHPLSLVALPRWIIDARISFSEDNDKNVPVEVMVNMIDGHVETRRLRRSRGKYLIAFPQ